MFRGLKIARVCYLLQCFGVGSRRYEIFVLESCFCKGGLWPPWKLRWLWNRRSCRLAVLFVIECVHVETLKVDTCLLARRQCEVSSCRSQLFLETCVLWKTNSLMHWAWWGPQSISDHSPCRWSNESAAWSNRRICGQSSGTTFGSTWSRSGIPTWT